MTRTQSVHLAYACLAFSMLASDAAAQGIERDAHLEMSVDISVTHTVLDREGNVMLPTPVPAVFTVARGRRSGGWHTVVTYRTHRGTPTRSSSHPLDGARIEFDDTSGETRVYNASGELNSMLSNDSTGGLRVARGPEQWLEGLVATPDRRTARSRDLQEKYGKAVGRVGGLDRFVAHREDVVEEVLADPDSGLPVEINTVRHGDLEQHTVFGYERRSDGAWIRRTIRAEQVLPGDSGQRARLTVEFSNVSTGGR